MLFTKTEKPAEISYEVNGAAENAIDATLMFLGSVDEFILAHDFITEPRVQLIATFTLPGNYRQCFFCLTISATP